MTLRRQLRNSLGSVFRPQDHILFSRLWTVPSSLVPRVSYLIASSLSIIINFFCGPCRGLLFFYSSCLLQVVQRILDTVLWPSPVKAHWVACQQNLCQTWEWTFSAPWNKMVMKCPPKIMVKFMSKKGLCQLKTDTCPLYLQRLNHGCCNCWVSMPLKVVQGENQEWGTLCSGKNWQNRSSHS